MTSKFIFERVVNGEVTNRIAHDKNELPGHVKSEWDLLGPHTVRVSDKSAEADQREKDIKDRRERIKNIDITAVSTIAALKPIIKDLIDELKG